MSLDNSGDLLVRAGWDFGHPATCPWALNKPAAPRVLYCVVPADAGEGLGFTAGNRVF